MTTPMTGLEAQNAYVREMQAANRKLSLIVAQAFVRGIRDIGYKHTGSALAEHGDNSLQAGAENIHIAFLKNKTGAKVEAIAVIDDGHGMEPGMIPLATMWGGTHRADDRQGMGKYGYGLPSASVSQGQRFTVYSCPAGGSMHAVTIDIEDIAAGKYTDADGDIVIPDATPAKLPVFVREYLQAQFPGGEIHHGTVVVIEKLDKLSFSTTNALRNHLLEFFGITYQKLLRNAQIVVDDTPVEPIDPLFITPGFRYYDLDADRATALDPMTVEVKGDDGAVKGVMEVRFSYMPPTFGSIDKTKGAEGKNQNPRFRILREYNGIMFYRMGRFLDCVRHTPFHTFVNNNRYFKIEVDFPAVLDEYFNVSTSKQRVDVSEKIWEKLKEGGIAKAIRNLSGKYSTAKKEMEARGDALDTEGKRASEEAMEETAKVTRSPSPEIRQRQQQRGAEHLRKEAEKQAVETGQPIGKIEEQLRLELKDHLYKLNHEDRPSAPFFRVEQMGGTLVLYLNTAHRFYTELYTGSASTPAIRAALEVMLFSIGASMNDATEHTQAIYNIELVEWSKRIDYALLQLTQRVEHHDGEDGDAVNGAEEPEAPAEAA